MPPRGPRLALLAPAIWLSAAAAASGARVVEAGGGEATCLLQHAVSSRASTKSRAFPKEPGEPKFPLWVWWDYGSKQPLKGIVEAALATWRVHAPESLFEVRYVNASNLARWLPGLPEEALRLPYAAAYSDLVRAGLLAEHGGVYLDTDIILKADLTTILKSLDDGSADIVTYENSGQSCEKGSFSSNFLAGVKGNALSKAWYAELLGQLKQRCPLEQKQDMSPHQGVCCYTPEGAPRTCHIPWGGIGERIGHPILRTVLASQKESGFRGMRCFREAEAEGFAPCGANCLWEEKAVQDEAKKQISRLYSRPAYHLFASNAKKNPSFQELLDGDWVVSELLRTSLGQGAGCNGTRSDCGQAL